MERCTHTRTPHRTRCAPHAHTAHTIRLPAHISTATHTCHIHLYHTPPAIHTLPHCHTVICPCPPSQCPPQHSHHTLCREERPHGTHIPHTHLGHTHCLPFFELPPHTPHYTSAFRWWFLLPSSLPASLLRLSQPTTCPAPTTLPYFAPTYPHEPHYLPPLLPPSHHLPHPYTPHCRYFPTCLTAMPSIPPGSMPVPALILPTIASFVCRRRLVVWRFDALRGRVRRHWLTRVAGSVLYNILVLVRFLVCSLIVWFSTPGPDCV